MKHILYPIVASIFFISTFFGAWFEMVGVGMMLIGRNLIESQSKRLSNDLSKPKV